MAEPFSVMPMLFKAKTHVSLHNSQAHKPVNEQYSMALCFDARLKLIQRSVKDIQQKTASTLLDDKLNVHHSECFPEIIDGTQLILAGSAPPFWNGSKLM